MGRRRLPHLIDFRQAISRATTKYATQAPDWYDEIMCEDLNTCTIDEFVEGMTEILNLALVEMYVKFQCDWRAIAGHLRHCIAEQEIRYQTNKAVSKVGELFDFDYDGRRIDAACIFELFVRDAKQKDYHGA